MQLYNNDSHYSSFQVQLRLCTTSDSPLCQPLSSPANLLQFLENYSASQIVNVYQTNTNFQFQNRRDSAQTYIQRSSFRLNVK
jgi:hypothetical protein